MRFSASRLSGEDHRSQYQTADHFGIAVRPAELFLIDGLDAGQRSSAAQGAGFHAMFRASAPFMDGSGPDRPPAAQFHAAEARLSSRAIRYDAKARLYPQSGTRQVDLWRSRGVLFLFLICVEQERHAFIDLVEDCVGSQTPFAANRICWTDSARHAAGRILLRQDRDNKIAGLVAKSGAMRPLGRGEA